MKHMLHVLNDDFVIPYILGDQLLYFADRGFKESVICTPSPKLQIFSKKWNCLFIGIPILRKFSVWSDFISIIKMCTYIKKSKVDIIIGHNPKGGFLAMISGFVCFVPKRVYFRHGLVYETSFGIKKYILMLVEKISSFLSTDVVCVSPYLMEKSIKDRLTCRGKLRILKKGSCNGVDALVKFNPQNINYKKKESLRSQLGIPQDYWCIGFVGRLTEDKGIKEILNTFSKFLSENFFLLLVGPIDSRKPLPLKYMKLINNNRHIIVTGMVDVDLEYYYSLMNVLVLPTYREGLGTCLLEAAAMEIPTITSGVTGSKDAIINGVTGLFTSLDEQDLFDKINFFYNDPVLCKEYGKRGRKFILSNFEQHLIWQELEHLYS